MAFLAIHRFARISPTKVHHVAEVVRGLSVDEGMTTLRFLHHRGARLLEAVIQSAKANAEDAGVRVAGGLKISKVVIGSGPTLKRIQPHARGVGFMIKKRTSHIRVELSE